MLVGEGQAQHWKCKSLTGKILKGFLGITTETWPTQHFTIWLVAM